MLKLGADIRKGKESLAPASWGSARGFKFPQNVQNILHFKDQMAYVTS